MFFNIRDYKLVVICLSVLLVSILISESKMSEMSDHLFQHSPLVGHYSKSIGKIFM